MLWRRLLLALDARVGPRHAAAVFFVGQLGKYVPGSVWSFAAQAQLGRRHGVPARSSVTASALFLVVHVFTGLLLGGLLVVVGAAGLDLPSLLDQKWWWVLVVLGALTLAPPVVRTLGDRLAGGGVRTVFGPRALVLSLLLMTAVWTCYGGCLWLLLPPGEVSATDLPTTLAAFAIAHGAGVLFVVAPAGLGAREGVLIALLTPLAGLAAAAAAALLVRVVHALADFTIAAGADRWARAAAEEAVRVDGA